MELFSRRRSPEAEIFISTVRTKKFMKRSTKISLQRHIPRGRDSQKSHSFLFICGFFNQFKVDRFNSHSWRCLFHLSIVRPIIFRERSINPLNSVVKRREGISNDAECKEQIIHEISSRLLKLPDPKHGRYNWKRFRSGDQVGPCGGTGRPNKIITGYEGRRGKE